MFLTLIGVGLAIFILICVWSAIEIYRSSSSQIINLVLNKALWEMLCYSGYLPVLSLYKDQEPNSSL